MKTRLLSVLAISAILFASCSNEENTAEPNDGRVKFSSDINEAGLRVGGAAGDEWNSGDAIGIYMIENGQVLGNASIAENANNVKYTTASTGTTATFTSTSPIYYPVNTPAKVDFVAYHPYSNTAIENYWFEMDVKDQSNQSAIDFMTASASNNGAGYDKTNTSAVALNFKHQLSKVIINVKKGDGVTDLTGLQVSLKGMEHQFIFDLENLTFVGVGSEGTPVITPFNAGNNSYELILPPTEQGADLSDYKMEFVVGGNTYKWTMTDNTETINELESGKKYTFDVTLTKTKVTASGTITAWTPVDGGTGIAN